MGDQDNHHRSSHSIADKIRKSGSGSTGSHCSISSSESDFTSALYGLSSVVHHGHHHGHDHNTGIPNSLAGLNSHRGSLITGSMDVTSGHHSAGKKRSLFYIELSSSQTAIFNKFDKSTF